MKANPFLRYFALAAIILAGFLLYSFSRNNSSTDNNCCPKEKCSKLMGQTEFIIWNSFTNDY